MNPKNRFDYYQMSFSKNLGAGSARKPYLMLTNIMKVLTIQLIVKLLQAFFKSAPCYGVAVRRQTLRVDSVFSPCNDY